jgi:hypothetical protein
MECVHLKEQPDDLQQLTCIVYSEIPEQVVLVQARVPEVTSMQVFECIGEEWKIPTPDILA